MVRLSWPRCGAGIGYTELNVPYLSNLVRPFLIALVTLAAVQVCVAADVAAITYRPPDPLNQQGFDHLYNLDHDVAIQDFEKVVAHHPNDPFALNHLLSAVL